MSYPSISIIIPAYNAEGFIARSIGCAQAQSGADIRIIVVDDGSTDGTADVVRGMAQADSRIELVQLKANRGRLEARRAGIERAEGDFVLFLDADDELAPDMANTLLTAQEQTYDIVQCDFEMRYRAFVTDEERRFNAAFNRPPSTTASGDDITHLVFLKRRTTWSLCGKLMRTHLLKQAMGYIPASSITQAEDACIFFIVSCLAERYRGLGDYAGYVYNIDEGHSDARWKAMSLEQFSYSCHYVDAMDAIRDFLVETGRYDALAADYETVRYEHVRAVADKLVSFMQPGLAPAGYEQLVKLWPVPEAVAGLSEVRWDDPAGCVEALAGSSALACSPREIRTVAAYHYRMGIGGAERVTAELAKVWVAMGLNVVLFCDEGREACAYDIPDSVTWVTLPAAASVRPGGYSERARALERAIREHEVDAFVCQQWWNPVLAWDMLLVKSLDVPFCVFCHTVFQILFSEANVREFDHSRILRHADGMVVLSEADKRFWSSFNPRVWQTNNPVTIKPDQGRRADLSGKDVVWVGRLSAFDKQPQEAIEIMARVIANDPECTLTLVGPAPSKRELADLKALAKRLKIDGNVRFVGAHDDPAPFYRQASVHLLTSKLEGWCLALAESKALGLPCVMYEMGYLTLTQGGRGIEAVAQGDRDGAARAVAALLADEDARRELGQEAFDHIGEIAAFDFAAFWTGIFDELGKGSCERVGFSDADAQWDLLLSGFKQSVAQALDSPVLSYAKRKGWKVARSIWHRIRP